MLSMMSIKRLWLRKCKSVDGLLSQRKSNQKSSLKFRMQFRISVLIHLPTMIPSILQSKSKGKICKSKKRLPSTPLRICMKKRLSEKKTSM